MRLKLTRLLCVMVVIAVVAAIMIEMYRPSSKSNNKETMVEDNRIHIVTTIYPIYLIGMNLIEGMDQIEVTSLINRNTGCLHDYQLTAEDMKVIATADVLVINGGGMEAFMEDISSNYPDLSVIEASQNITMLSEGEESEETQEANESETTLSLDSISYNSHVWLDPELYEKQIENVRDSLIQYINASSKISKNKAELLIKQITKNSQIYLDKVDKLNSEVEDYTKIIAKNSVKVDQQAVIFHEAFAYLANRIGMKVAFAVEIEADTALSAGNIAEIVDEVKIQDIQYLFTEEQYSDAIPSQIADETGAKVYIIDSVVTGDGTKDSYLKAMRNNLKILKSAGK